jgi:hypothetical protein
MAGKDRSRRPKPARWPDDLPYWVVGVSSGVGVGVGMVLI